MLSKCSIRKHSIHTHWTRITSSLGSDTATGSFVNKHTLDTYCGYLPWRTQVSQKCPVWRGRQTHTHTHTSQGRGQPGSVVEAVFFGSRRGFWVYSSWPRAQEAVLVVGGGGCFAAMSPGLGSPEDQPGTGQLRRHGGGNRLSVTGQPSAWLGPPVSLPRGLEASNLPIGHLSVP